MKRSVTMQAGFFACLKMVIMAVVLTAGGLYVRGEHYLGVTAGFDSPLLSDHLSLTSSRFGYGGMIGGEWLWKKNHFTFELGLQAAYLTARYTVSDETLRFNMRDTQNKQFEYLGYVNERRESASVFDVRVPLLFGLEYDYVYASLGAIGVYTVTGRSRQQALLTTVGDYDRYYEILTDMPNHGFSDRQPVSGRTSLGSGWDVRLYAELGTVWHTRMTTYSSSSGRKRGGGRQTKEVKWRAGLFFDYGVRDLLSGTNIYRSGTSTLPMTDVDPTQFMQVRLRSVYASERANDARLNNLSFGVRLTVLFPLSSSGYNFRSCHCVYL